MMRIGMHVISGVAAAPLFCASPGLIPPANAQTIGSTYTSTAPKDCRVIRAGNGVDDSTIRVCLGMAGLKVLADANELARKAADEVARGFKCKKDEVKVIGASGRAVELATRR